MANIQCCRGMSHCRHELFCVLSKHFSGNFPVSQASEAKLDLTVSHEVVGCRSRLLYSSSPAQLPDEFRLETLSLIAMALRRKTIADNEVVE